MTSDELELRKMLWQRHGCPPGSLYGDDGEMQCGRCIIDFKRDSVQAIESAFDRRAHAELTPEQLETWLKATPPPYIAEPVEDR